MNTPLISLWLPRHFLSKFSLFVWTKVCFLFYNSWLEMLQACNWDNQSCIILPGRFFILHLIPVSLKRGGFRLAFLEVDNIVIIFPLPAWFRGTRVLSMPGNLNSLSEQLSLGCFSKSTRAEEINDFAIEEGFLKKWVSLEKDQLNQLWAFCRMCGFHWLFYWKAGQCHWQGCQASCQPACHAMEQVSPETCLPQPQAGAPRSPGCSSESYEVFS